MTRRLRSAGWRPFLIENGKVDRRIWEIALALAVRDALRAGNLFLAESREPCLVLESDPRRRQLAGDRDEAYRQLDLPTDREPFSKDRHRARPGRPRPRRRACPATASPKSRTAGMKLKRPDAMPIPRANAPAARNPTASLPRVRIEDLLQDVDEWCGFTCAFQPLGGYEPRAGPTRIARCLPP